jgi:hypothetical protein
VLWLMDIVFGGSVSLGGFIPVTLLVIALLVSRAGGRRLLNGPTPGLKCAPAGPGDDGLANARICRCRGGFARPSARSLLCRFLEVIDYATTATPLQWRPLRAAHMTACAFVLWTM